MTDGTDLHDAEKAVRPGTGTTDPVQKATTDTHGTMPHPHGPTPDAGATDERAGDEAATDDAEPTVAANQGDDDQGDEDQAAGTDVADAADTPAGEGTDAVATEVEQADGTDAVAADVEQADGDAPEDEASPLGDDVTETEASTARADATEEPAEAARGAVWPVWGGAAAVAGPVSPAGTDEVPEPDAIDAEVGVASEQETAERAASVDTEVETADEVAPSDLLAVDDTAETVDVAEDADTVAGPDVAATDDADPDVADPDLAATDVAATDDAGTDSVDAIDTDAAAAVVVEAEEPEAADEVAEAPDEAAEVAEGADKVAERADEMAEPADDVAAATDVADDTDAAEAQPAAAAAEIADPTTPSARVDDERTAPDVAEPADADAAEAAEARPAASAVSSPAPAESVVAPAAATVAPSTAAAPPASTATPTPSPATSSAAPVVAAAAAAAGAPQAPPNAVAPAAPATPPATPAAPAPAAPAAPTAAAAAPVQRPTTAPWSAAPASPAPVVPPAPVAPAPAQSPAAQTPAAPAPAAPPRTTPPVPAQAAPRGPFAPVGSGAPSAASPIPSGPVPQGPESDGPERPASPLDEFEPEDGRRRWPRRLLVTAGVVVVLGAAYVGASYALADHVARGATVAGVDIGGLSSAEAVQRLETELADATTQPIPVVANDVQATIDPTAAGLALDAEATVATFTGPHLADPVHLWRQIIGEGEHPATSSVDENKLAAAVEDLTSSLALAPVDGAVVFVDAVPQATAAVDGWELDTDGAVQVLTDGWISAERPVVLPTAVVEPSVTQEETDAVMTGAARQLTSGPVSVVVADRLAVLTPATLAANASFAPTDGDLVLTLNGEGLAQDVLTQLPDLLTESSDAHFEFQGDAPVIVPGTPGTSLDPAALATAVTTASGAGERTAHVDLVQADPSESTAELEALGVKEIVAEFSTPLTAEPRRTTNIANGAAKISGTLIKPGETFSLTEALGPVDGAHGFVEAGAIISGEHTDAWGGGLSQLSTTTFNAAYLAGMEDVAHTPHSEWFARYPEGREATIFTGSIDMKWKNNTPYGALVQAWTADGRTYVRLWGTKYWTVESSTSARSGVVAPTTVYSQSPTCAPSSAGNPGFSVTVTRKTYLGAELKDTESRTTRYKPQNKVICGAPPAAPTP